MAVQFNDLSTAPAGYIVRWTWDFGDGNTQSITFPSTASVSHTYTQGGTFNVSLWVKTSDSCSSLLSKTLTVLPNLRQISTTALLALVLPFPYRCLLSNTTEVSPPGTGILGIPPREPSTPAPCRTLPISLIPPELIP
ncbi:MAG: PKD domain-containing protein [Bacteroidales bacterium]|nr:PKD domain-containing protein [Bacteroidales bacterium]